MPKEKVEVPIRNVNQNIFNILMITYGYIDYETYFEIVGRISKSNSHEESLKILDDYIIKVDHEVEGFDLLGHTTQIMGFFTDKD